MGESPRGRRRSRLQLLAACAAIALLVSACVNTGEPTSYDDTVEENFFNGCEIAAEADPAIRPVAQRYCACAWNRLITEIDFDDFKNLDDDIREDPDRITAGDDESTAATFTAIFDDCRTRNTRG